MDNKIYIKSENPKRFEAIQYDCHNHEESVQKIKDLIRKYSNINVVIRVQELSCLHKVPVSINLLLSKNLELTSINMDHGDYIMFDVEPKDEMKYPLIIHEREFNTFFMEEE